MPVRVNDEEWSEIRAESKRLQKEYSACQWNRENKENNRSEAARLSKKAISLKNRMNEAKKFAAEKIFKITNENCCEGEIDLHGLLVDEVIPRLKERIALAKKSGSSELMVIVGKGRHSKDGIPKLKQAVLKYALKQNIDFTPNYPNGGCILLKFESSSTNINQYNKSTTPPRKIEVPERKLPNRQPTEPTGYEPYTPARPKHVLPPTQPTRCVPPPYQERRYMLVNPPYNSHRHTREPDNHSNRTRDTRIEMPDDCCPSSDLLDHCGSASCWGKWIFRIALIIIVCSIIFFVGKFLVWIFGIIVTFFSDLGDGISGAYHKVVDGISGVFASIADFFSNSIDSIGGLFTTIINFFKVDKLHKFDTYFNARLNIKLYIFRTSANTFQDFGRNFATNRCF